VRFAARKRRRRTGDFTRARCERPRAGESSCVRALPLRVAGARAARAPARVPTAAQHHPFDEAHTGHARGEGRRASRVASSRAPFRSRVERALRRRVRHVLDDARHFGKSIARWPLTSAVRARATASSRAKAAGPCPAEPQAQWPAPTSELPKSASRCAPLVGVGHRGRWQMGQCPRVARELRGAPAVRSRRCGCCGSKE
jgi:hypothetical protein